MEDLVSIIISTYKRDFELERAIESIIRQTYRNIEIIIVDDNGIKSEYHTRVKEIIKKYTKYNNIKYIVNEENIGGALTRNRGIDNAEGEYIAFLDDDDEYYPEKIEKQIELFKNNKSKKLALIYCYTDSYDEYDKKLNEYRYDYVGNCLFDSMCLCIAATSQWLCKRKALINIGGFNNVPSKQDSTVIIKLLNRGYEVDRVPEILVRYNEHSKERISQGSIKNIKGEEMLRLYCRSLYNNLNTNEIIKVEESFSYRLSKLYIKNNNTSKAHSEMKILKKINIYLWIKVNMYYILKKLRYKAINL
ncbi:glycosyltransferase family 2 protein [Clostridium chauvoei]|uniref:Glycosyltransferase family 2 protein n=2 Tax=Clostridium chauvoei TaxID=46867 RepID=A0ABD4RGA6_9CLOT|nr:glycosyltransferase family 2 protein [Clostridium chauvoei]ATD54285.1 hypothetical protein BTM20_03155 [Clostridium chauvoei]ATD58032.1 hypothetical protein BTM21_09910 [Clostridium chauvoei]MBX7279891.1 glycosyltransferase family 2 protein [Clostridium chauvoei]MBX7282191.1 glycosyltransferase family 2 protein [Clostridium chauvoei]MBX7284781.1 glycosyltransferase family 2 protein [Clostridium chauvoei]